MGGAPVLWQYTFSNYSEKVRWALDHKGIAHERRSLAPGFPRAMLFSLRGTVPVLEVDGERVVGSSRIVEVLERMRPDPPLLSSDPDERRRVLEVQEFFDEHVGHAMRRAVFVGLSDEREYQAVLLSTGLPRRTARALRLMFAAPGSMAYARRRYRLYEVEAGQALQTLEGALDRIEAEAGPSGHFAAGRFTIADLTAAALLYPLVWPPEFPYEVPPPPRLGALEALARHPACDWIRETYRRHRAPSAAVSG